MLQHDLECYANVVAFSAIAVKLLSLVAAYPVALSLLLGACTILLCQLWSGLWSPLFTAIEPVLVVLLLAGWLWGYRRHGGRWGLTHLAGIVGVGLLSHGDAASLLPLLWGAGLGAMLSPWWGAAIVAVSADQGFYTWLSHSPFVVSPPKIIALTVFLALATLTPLHHKSP